MLGVSVNQTHPFESQTKVKVLFLDDSSRRDNGTVISCGHNGQEFMYCVRLEDGKSTLDNVLQWRVSLNLVKIITKQINWMMGEWSLQDMAKTQCTPNSAMYQRIVAFCNEMDCHIVGLFEDYVDETKDQKLIHFDFQETVNASHSGWT